MEFCPPGRKKVAVSGVSTVLSSSAYRWIHEREVMPVRYILEKADRGLSLLDTYLTRQTERLSM